MEIRVTDLRIGNSVLSDDCIVEVEGIYTYLGITTTANFEGSCNGKIYPIPLTEEWLIKLGFEKKLYNEHVKDNLIFRKRQNDLILDGFEYDYNGVILKRPEYVHQLQNLYFALTGEELTINE